MISDETPVSEADAAGLKSFRPLRWNELVKRGDFIMNGDQGFELWEGPSGFRADAFIRTIYRQLTRRTLAARRLL